VDRYATLAGAWWIDIPLHAVMIQIAGGVNKFSLLAIPFFVLAGAIMAEGGMARRLVAFAGVLVGFVRGGLSLVNITASTFFGAISGSSLADTASVGSVLIPEMEKKGYPREFSTAVTVSGSVQALLTPPSHNSVIYSLAAGGTVSISALFVAGIGPGLLLSTAMATLCLLFARKRNYPKGEVVPLRQALKICVEALWGLMTMVIILGGILSGVFTATESAAVALRCVHRYRVRRSGRGVGLLRHHVHLPRLQVARAAEDAAPHGAHAVHRDDPDRLRRQLRLHHDVDADSGEDHHRVPDPVGQPLRDSPVRQRDAAGAGHADGHGAADPDPHADPAAGGDVIRRRPGALRHDHAGQPGDRADMLVNLGIGLITPPVGAVLFVGAAIGKVTIENTVKALLPFYAALFAVLMAVTYIPMISLWLPSVVL